MHGRKKIAVINGPNINILGIREKHIYGSVSWPSIEKGLREHAETIFAPKAIGHINGFNEDVYTLGLQAIYKYLIRK